MARLATLIQGGNARNLRLFESYSQSLAGNRKLARLWCARSGFIPVMKAARP
jgi:hypothetical protein